MGWAVGWNGQWHRDVGYGVPATCDHPDCNERIDRGLGYVCGGEPPCSDSRGCQLFFCGKHLAYYPTRRSGEGIRMMQLCERCGPRQRKPFQAKPDVQEWTDWKLTDESWAKWRAENPDEVAKLKKKDSDQ